MGIDPGTNYTGYGLLAVEGGAIKCVALGYIDLAKLGDPYQKLRHIFERVSSLIGEFAPDEVAFESPFFGENVQSMLKLGRAQGVAMAAALVRGLPVYEYPPRLVKQSITGNGAASKEQVAAILGKLLKVEYSLGKLDATDGLAVALCHHFQSSSPLNAAKAGAGTAGVAGAARTVKPKRGTTSWETFVGANPGRILKPKK